MKRVLIITDEHPRFPGPAADAAQFLLIRELRALGVWDVHLAVAIKSNETARLEAVANICTLHQHVWDTGSAAASSIVYGPLRKVYHAMLAQPLLRSSAGRIKSAYFSLSMVPARVRSAAHPGFRAYVAALVSRLKPDVVLIQHSYLADLGTALHGTPYVVCVYDLLTLHTARARRLAVSPMRKLALLLEELKMHRYERASLAAADAVLLMTNDELRAYRELMATDNAVVVPVGVDLDYFSPQQRDGAAPHEYESAAIRFLYTGSFTYGPNLDALQFFAEEIAPLLTARLPQSRSFFVGPWAPVAEHIRAQYRARTDVIVTGRVEDTRPWFRNADAVIVPLRLGTGIRVKILEAMGMGLPVVATSVGAEGIEGENDVHLLIANTPAEFAAATVRLVEEHGLTERLTVAARALVERRYSIEAMTAATSDVLSRVIR